MGYRKTIRYLSCLFAFLLCFSVFAKERGDVDCNGTVNISDALQIAQASAGLYNLKPCSAIILFPCYELEQLIRWTINKQGGVIDTMDMKALKELIFDEAKLDDLHGLEYASSLTSIKFFDCHITNIQELAGCKALQYLDLTYNSIEDISPLAGLQALSELVLYHNNITDITPLSKLTTLTSLMLKHNAITDITPLQGLTSLAVLDLSANNFESLVPLSQLKTLTKLNLSGNKIKNLEPLQGLINLTDLQLTGTTFDIKSIVALRDLKSLTSLDLRYSNLTDITPLQELAGLPALVELILSHNEIEDLTPLKNFSSLKKLDLGSNPHIRDISVLLELPALKSVSFYGNLLDRNMWGVIKTLRSRGISVDW